MNAPALTCNNGRIRGSWRPRRRRQPSRGVENTYLRGALMSKPICAVDGCPKPRYCREWCQAHYARWYRAGDPGPAIVIPASVGMACEKPTHRYPAGRTGTSAGFQAHQTAKEESCDPCRTAWNNGVMERRRADPARRSSQRMLSERGITVEQYEQLLEAQGGGCAICHTTDPGSGRRFAIDHDHACCPSAHWSCGKCIRGLLCQRCNKGIGLLLDNPGLMRAAADYVEGRR